MPNSQRGATRQRCRRLGGSPIVLERAERGVAEHGAGRTRPVGSRADLMGPLKIVVSSARAGRARHR